MIRVLFVCTANIFRSMSAELLFRKYLQDIKKDKDIKIASAGTRANSFNKPYSYTLKRLKEYACDPTKHKATRVTSSLLAQSDLIICMANHHKECVDALVPGKSILFNDLAYHIKKDVLDDDEYAYEHGHDFDLEQFCRDTVTYLHDAMPMMYQNLHLFLKSDKELLLTPIEVEEEEISDDKMETEKGKNN